MFTTIVLVTKCEGDPTSEQTHFTFPKCGNSQLRPNLPNRASTVQISERQCAKLHRQAQKSHIHGPHSFGQITTITQFDTFHICDCQCHTPAPRQKCCAKPPVTKHEIGNRFWQIEAGKSVHSTRVNAANVHPKNQQQKAH